MRDVYQLTVPTPFNIGDTHIYLLKGDALSLVDAGVKTEEAWGALSNQLNKLGYEPKDIEQIFLTHHHPDHTGLIEKFPQAKIIADPYVDVWISRDENFLNHYEQFYKQLLLETGVPKPYFKMLDQLRVPLRYAGQGELTHTIDEGDLLPGHEDWQVIETKGHAQTHLSFLHQQDGLFIGGDHLLHHITPNPLLEPPYNDQIERPKPLLQYRKNLKKCLALDIAKVFPGHGHIFSKVNESITFQLNSQEKRAQKVFLLLKDQAQTPFEICRQLFPNQYKQQLSLTMSETIGQLDFLEEQAMIESFHKDGVIFYQTQF